MSKKDISKTSEIINASIKKDQIGVIDFLFFILSKVGIFLVTVIAHVFSNIAVLLETGIQLLLCDKYSFLQKKDKSNIMIIEKIVSGSARLDATKERVYWLSRAVFQGIIDSKREEKEFSITKEICNDEKFISRHVLKNHVIKSVNAWFVSILKYPKNSKVKTIKYISNICENFRLRQVKHKIVGTI